MAKNDFESNGHNQISVGTSIVGDINSEFDIRIDGKLTGNIETKGKLVLGPSGNIDGNVTCNNSVIEGKIEGKITVSELLTLKNTSLVSGDIIANKLSIEPGAKFTGNCDMSGNGKQVSYGGKKEERSKEESKEIK